MARKKIGLLTLDSKSYNYGGLLQEYALQQAISSLGYECKVLDYDNNSEFGMFSYKRNIKYLTPAKIINRLSEKSKQDNTKNGEVEEVIEPRRKRFDDFRKEYMAFSSRIISSDLSSLDYDGYVCGSDQIWNPSQSRPSFFLDFVDDIDKKVIYAASISRNELTKEEKRVYRKYLNRLKNVSVREERAKELVTEIVGEKTINGKEVEVVLDPTLLLDRCSWKEIGGCEPLVKGEYVFCYFLGIDEAKKKATETFAKNNGLKIVSIPYLLGVYNPLDDGFSKDLFPVGPIEFLNLILHARYVLTDSFHALLFSILFGKRFRVFGRSSGKDNMNSRIDTLLSYIGHNEYLIKPSEIDKLEEMNRLTAEVKTAQEIYDFSRIEKLKKMSIIWLKNSLEGAIKV